MNLFHAQSGLLARRMLGIAIASLGIVTSARAETPTNDRLHFEYGVIEYGDVTRPTNDTPGGPVFFAQNAYGQRNRALFTVPVAYNIIEHLKILNEDQTPIKVRVRFESPQLIPLGVVGKGDETAIEIPAGQQLTLPFKIFTQDATVGPHAFRALLLGEGDRVLDRLDGILLVEAPAPKLALRHLGSTGAIHEYEIENLGGELANFGLNFATDASAPPPYLVNPRIEHYLVRPGEKLRVHLVPTGIPPTELAGHFVAESAGGRVLLPTTVRLPTGRAVVLVGVDPIVRLRRKDWYCTNRPIIHFDYDIPYFRKTPVADVSFVKKFAQLQKDGAAIDTDADGRPDRWSLTHAGRTILLGDDYDGDGNIDFYRESDTPDRPLNRAFIKSEGRWFATNLADAHLISSFLPMTDMAAVNPHDVDVLLNDKILRRERRVVPRGSRIIRVRADYFAPANNGLSHNRVTVSTSHLPEQHYQVTAENTLVLHYTDIDLPVVVNAATKELVEKNAAEFREFDAKIRVAETAAENETNPAKQTFLRAQLDALKKSRDESLRLNQAMLSGENGAFGFAGVQSSGLDLGIHASEAAISDTGELRGIVRNMGYTAAAYRVEILRHTDKGDEKVGQREFPELPPFAHSVFQFSVPGHDPRRRQLYRVVITALGRNEKELVYSNNSTNIISGPWPGQAALNAELRYFAQELGLVQDQLTLQRSPEEPLLGPPNIDGTNTVFDHTFSAPLKALDKTQRAFILE